jgi:hypothetical protein
MAPVRKRGAGLDFCGPLPDTLRWFDQLCSITTDRPVSLRCSFLYKSFLFGALLVGAGSTPVTPDPVS